MRGTTPTHTFRVPINLTSAVVLKVYYKQGYEVLVEKEKPDLVVTPSTICNGRRLPIRSTATARWASVATRRRHGVSARAFHPPTTIRFAPSGRFRKRARNTGGSSATTSSNARPR